MFMEKKSNPTNLKPVLLNRPKSLIAFSVILWSFLVVFVPFLNSHACAERSLKEVTLQLKWKHQFQFAGYYAAVEKGFYASEGLKVNLVEGEVNMDFIDKVLSGQADYGVETPILFLARDKGKPVVALASIFQHSPVVMIAKRNLEITTPQSLIDKTIQLSSTGMAGIEAMFLAEGVSLDLLDTVKKGPYAFRDFAQGKIYAFDAYLTDVPYLLNKMKVPHTVINPLTYGIDFYGDCLFTSEEKINQKPDEVKSFLRASLKGWEYAMTHTQEIIDLILKKYSSEFPRDVLAYEAKVIEELMQPKFIEIGHTNPGRWKHIADTYVKLKMLPPDYSLDGFIYDPDPTLDYTRLTKIIRVLTALALLIGLISIILLFFNRRLNRKVMDRTKHLSQEIVDRKKAQEEVQKSSERFESLFELLPFSCVINDFTGRFLLVNHYFCATVKRPSDQLVGRTMEETGLMVDIEISDGLESEIKTTGFVDDVEVELQHEGEKKHILFSSRPIDWKGEKAILSAMVNITAQKNAEHALRESEENLRITLKSIGDGVISTDINGNVTRMNPIAEQLTGWRRSEALGMPLQKVFHIVNALTKEAVENPVHKVLSTGRIIGLANHTVLISRDNSQCHIADSGAPIRNDAGVITGVVLVFRDVTEEYTMQEQLRQAQKMEAIGVLAGGIAHDFNNILSALMGFTDLARMEVGDNEKIQRYLDRVSSASLRARDLVSHMLKFSHKSEVKTQLLNVTLIVKETVKFIRATIPANIEIRQNLKLKKALVMGDLTHIHQIMMNLLTNAGYAMRDKGGLLEVTMDAVAIGEKNAEQLALSPGPYLEIIVSDTGDGIPKDLINHVFEPFFTTKERGGGTGMGLATVHQIVKEMDGTISVSSGEGLGTRFRVLIPEADKTLDHMTPLLKDKIFTGKGRIMIVDDEEPIIQGTREILSKLGYKAEGFTGCMEALETIKADPHRFDLILTDMTMPQMNGLDFSRKIRLINPDVPIILCTGFSHGLTKEICESAGILDMVMKPMIVSELAATVYNALKKRSSGMQIK